MSGGFADSPHLFSRVTEWARLTNIEVERGEDCWGAVVRGAVLKGAGIGSTVPPAIRFCPRSYGISVSNFYQANPMVGLESEIVWLVRKGDYIPDNEPIKKTYDIYCSWRPGFAASGQIRVEFVATPADELPKSASTLLGSFPSSLIAKMTNATVSIHGILQGG